MFENHAKKLDISLSDYYFIYRIAGIKNRLNHGGSDLFNVQ